MAKDKVQHISDLQNHGNGDTAVPYVKEYAKEYDQLAKHKAADTSTPKLVPNQVN